MLASSAAKWILRNTLVSCESLTTEVRLRLITEQSPLWMSTPDCCPLPDPYWAFYWPGGQAVTRYILDNPSLTRNRKVLDFGCGCGSATIAAIQNGASHVMANDIDQKNLQKLFNLNKLGFSLQPSNSDALLATRINFRLNKVKHDCVTFEHANLLDIANFDTLSNFLKSPAGSIVILGDMFYDSDFAVPVLGWLKRLKDSVGARIFVGDPDRHPLAEEKYVERYPCKFYKELLHEYPLPGYVTKEHYGFTTAKVYEIHF